MSAVDAETLIIILSLLGSAFVSGVFVALCCIWRAYMKDRRLLTAPRDQWMLVPPWEDFRMLRASAVIVPVNGKFLGPPAATSIELSHDCVVSGLETSQTSAPGPTLQPTDSARRIINLKPNSSIHNLSNLLTDSAHKRSNLPTDSTHNLSNRPTDSAHNMSNMSLDSANNVSNLPIDSVPEFTNSPADSAQKLPHLQLTDFSQLFPILPSTYLAPKSSIPNPSPTPQPGVTSLNTRSASPVPQPTSLHLADSATPSSQSKVSAPRLPPRNTITSKLTRHPTEPLQPSETPRSPSIQPTVPVSKLSASQSLNPTLLLASSQLATPKPEVQPPKQEPHLPVEAPPELEPHLPVETPPSPKQQLHASDVYVPLSVALPPESPPPGAMRHGDRVRQFMARERRHIIRRHSARMAYAPRRPVARSQSFSQAPPLSFERLFPLPGISPEPVVLDGTEPPPPYE